MNQFYKKIISLKEAEEFKNVVKSWSILSENIKSKPTNIPIILPDMLWIAKSGVGKTNLLNLISEYLSDLGNLMEFFGDVKFFEFLLNYCSPDEPFTELNRLINEVDNAAGFRSEFKGIIHIDINEWIDHFEEKHFVSFMEYLSSNSDNWLLVLSVYPDKEEKIHNLNAFLSMYLRIEKVTLTLPKTEDFAEYVENILSEYGLTLQQDAKNLLHETITKLRKSKYFDGFKTINMLCQDIAYKVFSKEQVDTYLLTAKMISEFSADSEYVNKTVANIERVRKIGLINKGEEN